MRSTYWPQLDGLRTLAFAAVFVSHLGLPPFLAGAGSWLDRLSNAGWVGVELFFVLSGFLITRLLVEEYRGAGHIALTNFFMRRILRIWPLYYFAVVLGFLVFPVGDPQGDFRRQLLGFSLFLGNYSLAEAGFRTFTVVCSPLWSVCIEEHFYLGWGILVAIGLEPALLALVAISGAAFSVGIPLFLYAPNDDTWYLRSHTHLWSLMMGSLVGLAFGERLRPWLKARAQLGLLLPATLAYAAWLAAHLKPLPVTVILSGVYFGYLLLLSLAEHPALAWLSGPRLVSVGKLTYGLYVYHAFALFLADRWTAAVASPNLRYGLRLLMAAGLTYGAARLSWHWLEAPALALKARYRPAAARRRR